jgi:hypothetical protein
VVVMLLVYALFDFGDLFCEKIASCMVTGYFEVLLKLVINCIN